jgi:flavin-dependent dehydrogenase
MISPPPVTSGHDLAEIDGSAWDVIVLGAGPCGSAAAHRSATLGARTLLVDRADFPREKTCGCCLSAEGVGLASVIRAGFAPRAAAFDRLEVRSGAARAAVPVAPGVVISRAELDAALARGATDAGAVFRSGVHARLADGGSENHRRVTLGADGRTAAARASVVIVAVGLSGRVGEGGATDRRIIRRGAPIGVSTILRWPGAPIAPGTIAMHVGSGGYAGLARLDETRVTLAAALRPLFIRDAGGPAAAVRRTLEEAGVTPDESLDDARWLGSGTLTRRAPNPAGPRLLIAGDAAGYAQPFSGEGMSMALGSGLAAGAIAAEAALTGWRQTHAAQWRAFVGRRVRPRHRRCSALTRVVAHRSMAAMAVRLLGQNQDAARDLARLFSASAATEPLA